MKKCFTLLGFGLLVAIVALCSLSASAKAKPIKCDNDVTFVSHETFDTVAVEVVLILIDNSPDFQLRSNWNDFAIITQTYFDFKITPFNDPYLVRSQRWLKERNATISGKLIDRDTGLLSGMLASKKNC